MTKTTKKTVWIDIPNYNTKHQSVSETDDSISTFEISMFITNTDICNELFLPGRITKSVLDFMLDEKADCAFELLDKKSDELKVPNYIKEAIEWLIKN